MMNKKTTIILMLALIFIIICLFSILIYNMKPVNNISNLDYPAVSNSQNIQSSSIVQTSFDEIKISPNAIIIFFKHYNGCGHTIKSTENISSDMVNMSKNEFSALYSNWDINKFTSSEIELSKDFDGNCGEHFLVKSGSTGYVEIYNIKDDGSLDLIEETEIAIKYLADADIGELESGVTLYGKDNLNAYIENFE